MLGFGGEWGALVVRRSRSPRLTARVRCGSGLIALMVVGGALTLTSSVAEAVVSPATAGSSLAAGGFVNVVAASPNGIQAIAGTDVAGVFRSTSSTSPVRALGETWSSVNEDIMADAPFAQVDMRGSVAGVG